MHGAGWKCVCPQAQAPVATHLVLGQLGMSEPKLALCYHRLGNVNLRWE